jgi:pyrroline-5-carboxylate reductase
MAEALICGALAAKLYRPEQIQVADPDATRLDYLKKQFGIQVGVTNREVAVGSDVIVLAVKPLIVAEVLREIAETLTERLVISVAAGVRISRIMEACAPQTKVVRAMPNTPAMVGEGMTALAIGPGVGQDAVACARQIFESVGKVVSVEERLMDAV